MELLVLLIILFCLYLIYCLSFPPQTGKPQHDETIPAKQPDGYEAVVKNRFVLSDQSNSEKRDDSSEKSDKQEEKANIFADGNRNFDTSVIPPDELDEVFGEKTNPEDLDIEPDENEQENDVEIDAEEEAEEIRQVLGDIEGYAEGFSYDEFEKIVSSDAGRTLRIASLLDRSERSIAQDTERAEDKDTEYEKFDINQILS